jgi:hypothetical protein
MGKALLALGILTMTSVSCSTPSGSAFSRCPEINFTKPSIDENALLEDLRQLVDTPGVALVADYTDGGSFYLTVYVAPDRDFDVREKVSTLGWQRVDAIPSSAKPGSRVLGHRWNL